MKGRTAAILAVIGALVLAGGWYFGTPHRTRRADDRRSRQAGVPRARRKARSRPRASRSRSRADAGDHQGRRRNGAWPIAADYPVQQDKLRGLLTGLTELRLAEPRTTDPGAVQQARRGGSEERDLLEPQSAARARRRRQADRRADRRPPPRAHAGQRARGDLRPPSRREPVLAGRGQLPVDADPQLWLDRDIINIDHSKIATVGGASRRGDAGVRAATATSWCCNRRPTIRSSTTTRWRTSAARWRR